MILQAAGIHDVSIRAVPGLLSDHYNPQTKTVCLSEHVIHERSAAAVAVAAHEVGHALQHAQAYKPMEMRSALVPVVNVISQTAMPTRHECDSLLGVCMRSPFVLVASQFVEVSVPMARSGTPR